MDQFGCRWSVFAQRATSRPRACSDWGPADVGRTRGTLLTLRRRAGRDRRPRPGIRLAITNEQPQQAARDAASPPAGWIFEDVMTRRLVRGDYRTAGGGFVPDLKIFCVG